MLLEPRWWVDVGLPDSSNGIIHLAGNWPESTVVGLRVGSLANKEVLLVLLALRASLYVTRCHFRQDFHQRGRFSLFLSNSKHVSGLCHVFLLQWGQCFTGPLPGTSTPPPPFLSNASVNVSTFFARQALLSVGVSECHSWHNRCVPITYYNASSTSTWPAWTIGTCLGQCTCLHQWFHNHRVQGHQSCRTPRNYLKLHLLVCLDPTGLQIIS